MFSNLQTRNTRNISKYIKKYDIIYLSQFNITYNHQMRLQYPMKYKSSQNINIIQKHNIFTFINEFEKGVTFTFGKLTSIKKSGLRLFIPSIQELYRVDLRTRVRELPAQLIITKDNVSASINAVVYYQVVNAKESVLKVDNVDSAIQQLGQTELRDFLCQKSFSEILDSREELSEAIHKVMKDRAQVWGVEVEYLQVCYLMILFFHYIFCVDILLWKFMENYWVEL